MQYKHTHTCIYIYASILNITPSDSQLTWSILRRSDKADILIAASKPCGIEDTIWELVSYTVLGWVNKTLREKIVIYKLKYNGFIYESHGNYNIVIYVIQ